MHLSVTTKYALCMLLVSCLGLAHSAIYVSSSAVLSSHNYVPKDIFRCDVYDQPDPDGPLYRMDFSGTYITATEIINADKEVLKLEFIQCYVGVIFPTTYRYKYAGSADYFLPQCVLFLKMNSDHTSATLTYQDVSANKTVDISLERF